MKRWISRIAIGSAALILAVLVLGFGFIAWFQRSTPSYNGTTVVAGLAQPVQILRDRYAVPHIIAASYEDATFGLGYVHAQDRLWQMEMARRFIQGRLAEMLGSAAVDTDILMRSLGLYDAARQAVEHLSPESRRTLNAYAAGVNAFIAGHRGPWPIEFFLAGVTPPEPWTPVDSVAVFKGMAFQLANNASMEAARAQLLPVLGLRGVQEFFRPFAEAPLPDYLNDVYATIRTGEAFRVPNTTASDNWVVGGARSVSGKPLLANDPHLAFTMPSIWYLAHLSFAGENIVGGTGAGVPAVSVGRNDSVAWGFTATGADTQDLYLERINPDNSMQYQTPSGFAEFETRIETIKVRFGSERQVVVRKSRHGPVVSDVESSSFALAAPGGYVLALAWTALDPDDTSMDALLAMGRAKSANDFNRTTGSLYIAPILNTLFADSADQAGHIGLVLPGRVPTRAESNDSLGLVPAPGWDVRYDWRGSIPPVGMFLIVDPASGHIATANNRTVPGDYPYSLTREWAASFRYDRIEALLARTPKHSIDSFRAIQTDPVDNYALELKARLIAAGPFEGPSEEAARMVSAWDGAMLRDRPEPLIFSAWARALSRRIYGDELGTNFESYWDYRELFTMRVLDDVDGAGRWCDNKGTTDIEDCASRIRLALTDALAELSRTYGGQPSNWRWGDAHKAIHVHRPLGSFPVIGRYFNRQVEMDGGAYTLLRADNNMASDRPYAATNGSGYRAIYDLGSPDNSLYMISTGQSGNIFSRHYDDLLDRWARAEYITIPTDPNAVATATLNRLELQPASSSTGASDAP